MAIIDTAVYDRGVQTPLDGLDMPAKEFVYRRNAPVTIREMPRPDAADAYVADAMRKIAVANADNTFGRALTDVVELVMMQERRGDKPLVDAVEALVKAATAMRSAVNREV